MRSGTVATLEPRLAAVLSFVVTAYNAAGTVAETLASILAQSLSTSFEVVVVDDASTDDTVAKIEEFSGRTSGHVRLIRHDVTRGNGAARNTGIRAAEGDAIRIVDSDNVLPPGTAEAELQRLSSSEFQAVSVENLRFFVSDVADISHSWRLCASAGRSGVDELLRSTRVPAAHGNYMFTRALWEAVGGYEEGLGAIESWSFGVKHLVRGFEFGIAQGTSYLHRAGHDSYWVREARAGTNDRNALTILKREASRLPADARTKVEALSPGDPVLDYIDAGFLAPGGSVPTARARRVARARKRITDYKAAHNPVPWLGRSAAGRLVKAAIRRR
jgi:glycosyltransferase involved in cell wall biosynthesis